MTARDVVPSRRATLAAAGLLVLALASCSSGATHDLKRLSSDTSRSDGASTGLADLAPGSPVTFMAGDLCVRSGQSVRITSVEAVDPTGSVTVGGWGVRPDENGATSYREPVSKVAGASHAPVTTRCGSDRHTEFDVQLSASSATASVSGVRLRWAGGTTRVYLGLTLCAPGVPEDRCDSVLRASVPS